MRYLYDTKLWDKLEYIIELLIFVALFIAAVIKFDSDIYEAIFYITLAVIISPFSKIERKTKRYLLLSGFFLGLFLGYFN